MKIRITLLVMLGLYCLLPSQAFSQCDIQRENINDLSGSEQCELRNLMLDYLSQGFDNTAGPNDWDKYPIVDMHVNPPFGSFGDFHNYAEEFATWHRNYVQEMEEYILSQGFPQYVPLPYWSPHSMIPDAFYNYACPDGNGVLTYANLPESPDFPQYTNQGPFAPSANINFTQFDQDLDCSDWSSVDQFVGSMEGPHHDATHGAVQGTLGPAQSAPASTLFWLFHAYITDLHSCYLRECEGAEADLYVRDNATDDGSEPTIQPTQMWTSPDIGGRNEADGFSNTTVEQLCYKINDDSEIKPVYVYVRTWNRGNVPSINGINDVTVHWAKPSAGLNWPSPWNGVPTSNSCGLPVGGFIDSQPLRSVNGQYLDVNDVDMDGDNTEIIEGYTIYEFEWFPPDPELYVACFGGGWEKGHFCINARVDDGDGFDLSGNFYDNLKNNNDLALKNIYIYGEDDDNEICDDIIWLFQEEEECIFFGNYTEEAVQNVAIQIQFPTLKDQILLEETEIYMTLTEEAMGRWTKGCNQGEGIEYNKETRTIRFLQNNAQIMGMNLQPNEVHGLCLDIVGPPGVVDGKDFQCDIIQTVKGAEIGGERFTVKTVKNPEKDPKGKWTTNGSNDASALMQYNVFPNPATDEFTVKFESISDVHNITLLNTIGKQVKKYETVTGQQVVNTANIGNGIFFVRIENLTNGEIAIQKVIIE